MKQFLDYADIVISAPCYLGYLCMADKFCKKYLEASRKNERLFMTFSFVGWLAFNLVSRWFFVPYIFLVTAEQLLFMGLVLLLFRERREKKIMAVSMLTIAMTLVSTLFTSFFSCLVLFFQHTVKMVSQPFLSVWETGVIGGVSCCLVLFAVYWMREHLEPFFSGKPGKWYVILALPLILMAVVFDVAGWGASHGIMVRSGGMGVYYDQMFSHAEFFCLALLCMFSAGGYVFGMNRLYSEREKSGCYYSQAAVYKMLTEQYRQSERLRHDMKNHIIALSALSRNKEWEKIDSYLKNMEGSGLEEGGDMTGNKAVDALLYQKQKRANEKNIKWECDVQIPKDIYSIREFDLCVLFGNILDNALEACGRMRNGESCFINIQAKTVKKCFLIEVRNSVDMAEKRVDGFTNKENPREHGIGLLNISDVVRGYHGILNLESEKGVFITSVLIPLNDAAHDVKAAG